MDLKLWQFVTLQFFNGLTSDNEIQSENIETKLLHFKTFHLDKDVISDNNPQLENIN